MNLKNKLDAFGRGRISAVNRFKGWMQTAIVHCRDPSRLVADLGVGRALAVFAMFAGSLAGPLFGPVFAVFLVRHAFTGRLLAPTGVSEIALSTFWCVLALAGFGALAWPLVLGMRRQGRLALWPALLRLPLWTLMLSLAAWRALFELCWRPYHWDKTEHGLSETDPPFANGPADSGEEPLFE